ncbi:MFS transporter [Zavarzinella formosa]|uniref:MFS transporter n=1 Tax=Zavarzinella formosa TaxID=360055 RepID=UPI0003107C2F|nr:MFS transporter [Zavarzinella formosa]
MNADRIDYDDEPSRPTRARFVLALWLCGLSAVLYLDRICMSQASVPIQEELGLNKTQMSYVLMAFSLAYGLCEVPTGRMGDRFGSRSVLTRIVIWWSIFTGLTGACSGLLTLMIVRFLFGAGEAGALPNAARVIARWYPVHERGRVQGLMLAAAQFGAVLAPVGAGFLIECLGWKWSFGVFGLVGVVWAIGFWWWFRDDPAEHSGVNAAELAVIHADLPPRTLEPGPVPWARVFSNRGILVLGLIMILGAFYTYFFYSWFSNYLRDARGMSNMRAGALVSIVLAGSAVGMLFGGWLADQIPKWSSNPIDARRYLGVVCYLVASGSLFLGIRCDDSMALAVLWGVSFCSMHITLPNWWSVAIPQCGRHVGALFGLMNGVGVIGAMASQLFAGVFADLREKAGYSGRERWDPMFDVYCIGLVLSAVAWWCYRYRPLEPEITSIPAGESA